MENRFWFLKRNFFAVIGGLSRSFSIGSKNLFAHPRYTLRSSFNICKWTFRALYLGRGCHKLNALHLRNYSSIKSLNPNWVTGFSDGEGCFHVSITENRKLKLGWWVQLIFQIGIHKIDSPLLEEIKNFFGVGSITGKTQTFLYRVCSIEDINVIVNHFNKYLLITEKCADYKLFLQVHNLMLRGEHLNKAGFLKIVAIKASMNRGLSNKLKIAFPDVKPTKRPLVKNVKIEDLSAHWLAGFTSADGCFIIRVASKTNSLGSIIQLEFIITQHVRNKELLIGFINYFGCGRYKVRTNSDVGDYKVSKLKDIVEKIIPFFKKYQIIGVKYEDFADWCHAAELMNEKGHLTKEGLYKIEQLKSGMNKGRK